MTGSAKKREGITRAAPVIYKGVRYEVAKRQAASWGSDPQPMIAEMILFAMDNRDGRELWNVKLYQIDYEPELERDKQEVYVTSLSLNLLRTQLKAIDEKKRRYVIDLKSHDVAVK